MVVFIFVSMGGTKAELSQDKPILQKRSTTKELIERTDCFKLSERVNKSIDSFHIEVQNLNNAKIHDIK